ENVGLVIVGDGPQRRNIESKIRELGVGDRVWLAGNQGQVLPWLQSLDVFALPSYANEGVPQALVQAMLCGLPCVTTACGGIGEIARDGTTAVLVRTEDAADLRRGLEEALGDAELRRRLGTAARFNALKARMPLAQIDAYIYKDTLPMLEGHPAIHAFHLYDYSWKRLALWRRIGREFALLRAIRGQGYDLVINLTEGDRGAL